VTPPPLGTSILAGTRAAAREAWLVPVSALLSTLRTVATVPALAVAAILPVEGAVRAARRSPLTLTAPIDGALSVLGSGSYQALVGGLLIVGVLAAGLLRVLFLAGALPTLGASLAGGDGSRRFAAGVVWGFPRQLATWLLSALADAAAAGFLLAGIAGALMVTGAQGRHPVLAAVLGAAVLAIGLAEMLAARVLGDVAAARCAILGEGAAQAFAGATRRLLARPGALALGGIAAVMAGMAAAAALQPAASVLGVAAARLHGPPLLGPQLMLGMFAVLAAAAVDLAWLGTAAALACGDLEARGEPPGPSALQPAP
jgi:hypothetical protein